MGFNMSWIFVDGIELGELYGILDVKPTGKRADPYDLGTGSQPLAGLRPSAEWCAVFAHYSHILDLTLTTDPPRLQRLPAKSRAVSCVVLEHAMISHASLWHAGRHVWQVHHQPSVEHPEHLEFWGDMPAGFFDMWETALQRQKERNAKLRPGEWGVDILFDVPLQAAATMTGFLHDRGPADREDGYRDLALLEPLPGNQLDRLSNPAKWWQTVNSIEYK